MIAKLQLRFMVSGKQLENILHEGIEHNNNELKRFLSEFNRDSLFSAWRTFIQQLEEFINVFYEFSHAEKATFSDTYMAEAFQTSDANMKPLMDLVCSHFGEDVARRFFDFVSMYARTSFYCFQRQSLYFKPFVTIGDLFDYCCQRRLHYMTVFSLIPLYAKGSRQISSNQVMPMFVDCVERILCGNTGACHAMIETRCLSDFAAKVHLYGLEYTNAYSPLESVFLEPVRMSELDLLECNPRLDKSRLRTKKTYTLYSSEELDAHLFNTPIYYEKYGLSDNVLYKELVAFVQDMRQYFIDDYQIRLADKDFQSLKSKYPRVEFYKDLTDMFDLQNSRYALVRNGSYYYSTFFMLIRFYFNYTQRILRRNRTFQIDSGFIFEKKAIAIVEKYGFKYHPECKRIMHKEFDVVCTKDNRIYNFQCKNNYFDVTSIDADRVNVSARYHRTFSRYYDRALQNEYDREQYLKDFLHIDDIQHYVISRFPVITSNPSVIPFNKFEEIIKAL